MTFGFGRGRKWAKRWGAMLCLVIAGLAIVPNESHAACFPASGDTTEMVFYSPVSNSFLYCGTGNPAWTSVPGGAGGGVDRITSGTTTAVVNSASTYISLSTGATTWGYLSSATTYLPLLHAARVSATNISATTGHFSGNVGIGTLPGASFHVFSPTLEARFVRDLVTDTGLSIQSDNTGPLLDTIGAHTFRIFTNAGERLRVDSAGNVGLGSTAPTVSLTVVGEVQISNTSVACSASNRGALRYTQSSGVFSYCNGTNSTWTTVGSGGGGSVATLTDVQLTNLAGRDYLRYDSISSKWVNISESTVMSTTTMVNGWPDAILCAYSGNTSDPLVLIQGNTNAASGQHVYYYTGGSTYYVTFNSNGSFNSQVNMATTGSYPCTASISQLYAQGRAFNFVGGATWSQNTTNGNIWYNGGNVGIGSTTVPAYALHVSTTAGAYGVVQTDGNVTLGTFVGSNGNIGTISNHGFGIFAAGGNGLMVTAQQRVGINTLTPAATLQVSGSFIVSNTIGNAAPALFVSGTTGRIGLGTLTPAVLLDVSGTIASRGYNNGAGTTFDLSQGNVLYTSAACGSFTLTNMVDGGTYMIIAKGSGTGPATFAHTGLTAKTTATLTCTSAKHTVFSITRAGSDFYVTMVSGY